MNLSHVKRIVFSIQDGSQLGALLMFLLYWPIANLYWIVTAALMILGKEIGSNAYAIWNPIVIAGLMMFAMPLWAIGVFVTYYLALALSVISMRPIPLLLSGVAWLSLHGFIPGGHLTTGNVVLLLKGEVSWLHPLLYSGVTLLGSFLVLKTAKPVEPSNER